MLNLSIPLFFNSKKWLGHDSTDVCLCQGWWGYGADAARCWRRSECWGEAFCWLYLCFVICLHLKLPPETVAEGKSQELKRKLICHILDSTTWTVKSNCIRLTLGFSAQKGWSHRTYRTGNIDLVCVCTLQMNAGINTSTKYSCTDIGRTLWISSEVKWRG